MAPQSVTQLLVAWAGAIKPLWTNIYIRFDIHMDPLMTLV
jgi:hypothetical protein